MKIGNKARKASTIRYFRLNKAHTRGVKRGKAHKKHIRRWAKKQTTWYPETGIHRALEFVKFPKTEEVTE